MKILFMDNIETFVSFYFIFEKASKTSNLENQDKLGLNNNKSYHLINLTYFAVFYCFC